MYHGGFAFDCLYNIGVSDDRTLHLTVCDASRQIHINNECIHFQMVQGVAQFITLYDDESGLVTVDLVVEILQNEGIEHGVSFIFMVQFSYSLNVS